MRKRAKWVLLLPVVLLGLAHADRDADSVSNWRLASRAPVGLAPDPADTPEAVVQVYAARAARWRGYFGVHTWIAAKPTNAPAFTVYEVTGFQVRRGGPAVRISQRSPDGRWFGSAPDLLADMRGAGVDAIIGRIGRRSRLTVRKQLSDPAGPELQHVHRVCAAAGTGAPGRSPGARRRQGLPGRTRVRAAAELHGGTGEHLRRIGLLAAAEEGLEVNVLGLTFGLDPSDLALKLPLVGSIGFDAWDTLVDDSNSS